MSVQPGSTIGRYQIISTLGLGGMATVYKAFHPALDRTVAIKVIRAGLTEDADFLQRFQQEAKAVARLRHPNIVQVFDFDEADGHLFIVMEHLEGGTLKQRLRTLEQSGQRLPRRDALRMLGEIAEGIAHAHGSGILHRDVKPANVLLTRDGRAVVTDFGIAKIVVAAELTRTGVGIGTPEYMSPEQARGEAVDPRADIYSLGVMGYEMVTGRVPYTADTALGVILKHLNEPLPPPSTIDPHVGESTERVLTKVLAKDPSDRYPTALEFAQALGEAFAEDERDRTSTFLRPAAVAPATPPARAAAARPAWVLPAVAVVAVALVAGMGLTLANGLGDPRSPAPTAAPTATPPQKVVDGTPFVPTPLPRVTGARYVAPVVAGGMTPEQQGPQAEVRTEFIAGGSFGLKLTVESTTVVERLQSVGPVTVDHSVRGRFGSAPGDTLVHYCCVKLPDRPGSYTLRVISVDSTLLAEIPYTLR